MLAVAFPNHTPATLTLNASTSQPEFLSVGDVARLLGVKPRDVSDLLYDRQVPADEIAPVVAGRRLIHADQVPTIAQALHRAGKCAALH